MKTHLENVTELIDKFAQSLKEEAGRLLSCGAVDLDDYNSEEYALAKIIITAAIINKGDRYYPLSADYKREVKNLTKF